MIIKQNEGRHDTQDLIIHVFRAIQRKGGRVSTNQTQHHEHRWTSSYRLTWSFSFARIVFADSILHTMELKWFVCMYIMIALLAMCNVDAARGGGRRGGSRKTGSRGSSRMQIFIPRNQDGVSYYDNTNVSIKSDLFLCEFIGRLSKTKNESCDAGCADNKIIALWIGLHARSKDYLLLYGSRDTSTTHYLVQRRSRTIRT